jgi:thiol-disulfide isomerase/thioredoxin
MANTRLLGWCGAGAVLAAVVIWGAYFAPDLRPTSANFNLTLKDMHGRDVPLAQFKGKPLLVNFWATWCGPCLLEAPELVELAEEYKGRVNIIGVSTDDAPEQIREFARANKIGYPLLVGRDREDVATAFGLGEGIPMTVFVKADGTIVSRLDGINTKEWFRARIQSLF